MPWSRTLAFFAVGLAGCWDLSGYSLVPDAGSALDAADANSADMDGTDGPADASCDPTSSMGGGCGSSLACYLDGDSAACAAPSGSTVAQGLCGNTTNCIPGYACVDHIGQVGACARVCHLGTACGAGLTCRSLVGSGPAGTFGVCVDCDPTDLSGGGCAGGSACVPYALTDDPAGALCMHSESAAPGAICGYSYSCTPGYSCVAPAGQAGTCQRVCRLSGSACTGGLTCRPIGSNTVYGACQP
jgi:hypothetical protein